MLACVILNEVKNLVLHPDLLPHSKPQPRVEARAATQPHKHENTSRSRTRFFTSFRMTSSGLVDVNHSLPWRTWRLSGSLLHKHPRTLCVPAVPFPNHQPPITRLSSNSKHPLSLD